ncbi:MAG: FlgD immunoglobulin-like domain containing protein [Candidatus Eisenbacteria bacterium]
MSGVLALVWLALRSGAKPSRLTYPCQRAAIGTATAAFAAPVVAAVLAARRSTIACYRRSPILAMAGLVAAVLIVSFATYRSQALPTYSGPVSSPRPDYRAQIYHVSECPQDPAGDHFVGLSNLLLTMGRGGLKFYESDEVTPLSGPEGVIAKDDVVIVKINYQWDQRGGTNTDLLRALIRAIVDHPGGFTGEVVVCENAQFNPVNGFDRANNNAQDHSLSPHDVVAGFQEQGYRVSHYDWTSIRASQVTEYTTGNMNDGYVVEGYSGQYQGKLSYAKFCTAYGTYVSVRYGTWDPGTGEYDRAHLKFVNVPVLKSHHATYGATVCTKHYMGVVTDQFSTNSHNAIRLGIMGALMGEIQTADLNIVDAIWINANPNTGPQTTYAGATRRDELVASLDPIAIDRWSVKNILIPGFLSNGFNPPWPNPSADPDLPSGSFRTYLDNSMNQLLAAGKDVTNDYAQMDLLEGKGWAGDFDQDGAVDTADYERFAACYTGPGGGPVGPDCEAGDFDGDGDVDCDDWACFKLVWTDAAPIPQLPDCDLAAAPDPALSGREVRMHVAPNPMDANRWTTIAYSVRTSGPVTVNIYDAGGRLVRNLSGGVREAGDYSIRWDGRGENGAVVPSGVYWARVSAAGDREAERIIVR